jgi:hypothetical protein
VPSLSLTNIVSFRSAFDKYHNPDDFIRVPSLNSRDHFLLY